jgi:FixJ family two-component response regulator
MSGRDLAGQIMGLCPGIRILFMSGYTADVIAHQGVLDNGMAFIQKPFSMHDLLGKVRGVLDMAPE